MHDPTVRMFDISADMLDMCLTNHSASLDIETHANEGEDSSGALDPQRGHVSLITVRHPLTHYTEVVRLSVRGVSARLSESPKNLARLLCYQQSVKMFHHALFDLRFLYAGYVMESNSVVCTKVAEKILRPGVREKGFYSLKGLAKRYAGVDMAKGYALSDWEAPELTPEQLRYAVEDVAYLDTIFAQQALLLRQEHPVNEAAYRTFGFMSALVTLEMGYGVTDVLDY